MPVLWLAIVAASLYIARTSGDDGVTLQLSSFAPIDLSSAHDGMPIANVVPGSPAANAGLKRGNVLLSVDGIPVSDAAGMSRHFFERRAGAKSVLTVHRGDGATPEDVALTLAPAIQRPGVGSLIFSYISSGAIILVLVVALALMRPALPAARVLLVLGGSQSLWQALDSVYGVRERWLPLGWDPVDQASYLGALVNVVAVLHLVLLFPEPSPAYRWLRRLGGRLLRPIGGGIGLLYALPLAIAATEFLLHRPPVRLLFGLVGLYFAAAVLVALASYLRPASAVARAQLTWVASGTVASLAVLAAGPLVQVLSGGRIVLVSWAAAVALWGLFYLGFSLAIVRYRLLDVTPVFKATLLYPILTLLLVAGYAGASLLIGEAAEALLGIDPASDTVPSVLAALAVAVAAHPLRVRLHQALDRLLYRERRAIQRYFNAAAAALSQPLTPGEVAKLLTTEAVAQLNLDGAWLIQPSGHIFSADNVPQPTLPGAGTALLERVEALIGEADDAPQFVVLADEGPRLPFRRLPPRDAVTAAWAQLGARMLVPLTVGPRALAESSPIAPLVGLWVIGNRRSSMLPDRQDLDALRRVAQLASVVLGYVQLLEQAGAGQERFTKAFHASPVPISIRTLEDGRYVDVNESFLRHLGYRREDVVGRTVGELQIWADDARRTDIDNILRQKDWVRSLEVTFRTKSGALRSMLLSAELIELRGETCVLSLIMDITERQELMAHIQEQQRTLTAQVEELQRSRRLVTMAEERLRRDIAEMLHGRVQTRLLIAWQRLDQVTRLVSEDSARAATLIEEIRADLDEIREHEIRQASHLLHPSIVGIGIIPAIRSLASRFERHFAISVEVDPEIETLDSILDNKIPEDLRLALYRVTEEGLGNALKHGQPTAVQIALAGETAAADPGITLRLRDNGKGFNPTSLKRGLGVHSIAARVEQFGGTWTLTSSPGAGTELAVRLPLAAPQSVLLVDDEPSFLQIAQELVEREPDFRVTGTATSGDEALAMLPVLRPDIAIVDVQMPGAGGFAVAAQIREQAPRVRVILVSGNADPSYQHLAASVGAGFISKRDLSSQAVAALIHPN